MSDSEQDVSQSKYTSSTNYYNFIKRLTHNVQNSNEQNINKTLQLAMTYKNNA